jgi:Ras-related protein Rab-8A
MCSHHSLLTPATTTTTLSTTTTGQERFRTITTAYYRGAMGILLVYDVTDEQSFQNIRNWIRNIEQHAADNVDKLLVGNKCDMTDDKLVETSVGQALAAEYNIDFFETSAKNNINVVECFTSIAKKIKTRLVDNPAPGAADDKKGITKLTEGNANAKPNSGCCK